VQRIAIFSQTSQNLLALAGMPPAVAPRKTRSAEFLLKEPDADLLIHTAVKEGLAGIVYKNLQKSKKLDSLNARQREQLESAYYRALQLNLKLNHALKQILPALNQGGIRVVLLQGMELLHGIYNDFGLRPISDIDLWVHANDFNKLIYILKNQGYRRDPLYPNTFRKGIIVLDIHTHILWADRIRSRKSLLVKSQDAIYQKTRLLAIDGQPVRCLGSYDQVLYLGLHALKHNVDRLIWLFDITYLVADWDVADWRALLARARELGQEKCIAHTFYLIRLLLDYHIPAEIRADLVPLNPIEKKILRLRQKKGSLPEWSTLILFSSGKGPLKSSAFILETLFPRPEILRQVFAEAPGLGAPRLYTRRFFQLIKMMRASLK